MNAKTKKWLAVWLIWLGIHFVLLFWWGDGWEPNHDSYLDIDGDIWPFSGGDLDLDYDIVRVPSRPVKYFMGQREMEATEVKLLIDAVASSRFITEKKSKDLADKIANLASENQRQHLIRHIRARR